MSIIVAINEIFQLIKIFLVLYIFLTWIPQIKWENEPFKSLHGFSEIFLSPFRKLIPPIGMIDISPIVAFIALSVLQTCIVKICLVFIH